jgi:AmmeMemoRadiSam system protein B
MNMSSVRPAAVAGSFYPGDARTLARALDDLLAAAPSPAGQVLPKAVIAPHAGYVYSGPVAARAYACLAPGRGQIHRVILLGPVHRVPVRGLAAPSEQITAFATPLGNVELDREALDGIRALPQVVASDAAHAHEHSLEVHLPFLQRVLGDFKLVPLAVGDASPTDVAEVLDRLWGGAETLVVVSSDLSHFLDYAGAREIDDGTAKRILALDATITHEQACGGTPINGLLLAARRRHLDAELLDLRNSGDTAGSRDRVVGYASFAFSAHAAHSAHSAL